MVSQGESRGDMYILLPVDSEGVSVMATVLPRWGLMGGVRKIEDMVWIREVFQGLDKFPVIADIVLIKKYVDWCKSGLAG
jgi:hypothetical protein